MIKIMKFHFRKISKPRRKNPGKYENIKKIEDVDKMKHVLF